MSANEPTSSFLGGSVVGGGTVVAPWWRRQ